MKFNCRTSSLGRAYKKEIAAKKYLDRLTRWHDHFALLPIRIEDEGCRWLETVERRFQTSVISVKGRTLCQVLRATRAGEVPVEYRPKQRSDP